MNREAPERIFMPLLWEDGDGTTPVTWQAEPDDVEYTRRDMATQFVSVDDMASFLHRDLVVRHHLAAKAGDEGARARLFALIEEIEWAYPNNIPQPPEDSE